MTVIYSPGMHSKCVLIVGYALQNVATCDEL